MASFAEGLANVARQWIEDHPADAWNALLDTRFIERYADCGRCAGRDACQWVHSMNAEDIPECVPVYRIVPGPAPSTGDTEP